MSEVIKIQDHVGEPYLRYRPEIEGLRALAVLSVIGFHADIPGFSGGFSGVDVFFVISGYLISGVLLDSLRTGEFSFFNFYVRRARRLAPALLVVLLFTSVLGFVSLTSDARVKHSGDIISALGVASNIWFSFDASYFNSASIYNPVLHLWSLSVEEQFYLIFPLFLIITLKTGFTTGLLFLAAMVSLFLTVYLQPAYPTKVFYLTPFRAWEFLFGALALLFTSRHISKFKSQFLSLFGLGLILFSIALLEKNDGWPGLGTLYPVVGTALILCFSNQDCITGKILAFSPLRKIGSSSYSSYLWHQPVFAYAHMGFGYLDIVARSALAILSLVIGWISYMWVENKFRVRQNSTAVDSDHFARTSLSIFAALIVFNGSIVWSDGLAGQMAFGDSPIDVHHKLRPNTGLSCATGEVWCVSSDSPKYAVWGDSYAMMYATALASSDELGGGLLQLTKPSCAPILDLAWINGSKKSNFGSKCIEFNELAMQKIKRTESLEYVFLSSRFDILKNDLYPATARSTDLAASEVIIDHLKKTINELQTAGLRVVLIGPIPWAPFDVGICIRTTMLFGLDSARCDFHERTNINEDGYKLFSQLEATVETLDPSGCVCKAGFCDVIKDDVFMYRDDSHITVEAGYELGRRLKIRPLRLECN